MKISEFLSENFRFLVVKFLVYFNKRVFVMWHYFFFSSPSFGASGMLCFILAAYPGYIHLYSHKQRTVPTLSRLAERTGPTTIEDTKTTAHYKAVDPGITKNLLVSILEKFYWREKVRQKSRECHNHKPQPFPDNKKKRKQTKLNKRKSNKQTKSTKISSLFPK